MPKVLSLPRTVPMQNLRTVWELRRKEELQVAHPSTYGQSNSHSLPPLECHVSEGWQIRRQSKTSCAKQGYKSESKCPPLSSPSPQFVGIEVMEFAEQGSGLNMLS
ncbi:UNVERIFIED_CONTAM: hypothetical protein K2H54_058343 [Gekko kuhli]